MYISFIIITCLNSTLPYYTYTVHLHLHFLTVIIHTLCRVRNHKRHRVLLFNAKQ